MDAVRTQASLDTRHTVAPADISGTGALLERYAAAWRTSDLAAMADCYAADFTLHYFGANPLSGCHAGRDRARWAMAEFGRCTRRKLICIEAVMAGKRRGAIVAREAFRHGRGSVELERVLVYAVESRHLQECRVYDSEQRLIDAIISEAWPAISRTPLPLP